MSKQRYESIANASFGELIQGCLPSGDEFLVTLPIRKYSRALFVKNHLKEELLIFPSYKTKIRKLVRLIELKFCIHVKGSITLICGVPEGKGLSSSTADLVSCARLISDAYCLDLSAGKIDQFLRKIEPSDGVAHDGIVAYSNKACRLIKKISSPPRLTILSFDEGGIVDTLQLSKKHKTFSQAQKLKYQELLKLMTVALIKNDLDTVGSLATKSTIMWQERHPKPSFFKVMNAARLIDGLGVVNTHSGTCLGILLNSRNRQLPQQISKAKEILGPLDIYETLNHSV